LLKSVSVCRYKWKGWWGRWTK